MTVFKQLFRTERGPRERPHPKLYLLKGLIALLMVLCLAGTALLFSVCLSLPIHGKISIYFAKAVGTGVRATARDLDQETIFLGLWGHCVTRTLQ